MKLLFESCTRIDHFLYFACINCNLICRLDIYSGDIVPVSSIPECSIRSERVASKIIYFNECIYVAPLRSQKIWKYDLSSGEWTGYARDRFENWTSRQDISQAFLYDNKIFFIGCLYPSITVLDLLNDDIQYVTAPYDEKKELAGKKKEIWFRTDYVIKSDHLYLASCLDNAVLCFNLKSYDYEYISLGKEDNSYSGIGWDGKCFYISPRNRGPVVKWSGKEIIEEINIDDYLCNNPKTIGGVVCLEDRVVFPAIFSPDSLELIVSDNSLKSIGKQFLFYEKIDSETVVNLDSEGIISIAWKGENYVYESFLSDHLFWRQYKNRPLESGLFEDAIVYEKNNDSLRIFTNIL